MIEKFSSAAKQDAVAVGDWEWHAGPDSVYTTTASGDDWRAALGADSGFVRFAFDIARLYLIYAPLCYEPGRRRIVKFSYSEYLGDGQTSVGSKIKAGAVQIGVGRAWNDLEDWLEGLPARDPNTPEQWSPPLHSNEAPTIRPRRRLFEALGWTTRLGKFETPAVSHGASYHLDISTPNGIQVRRAQIVTIAADGTSRKHTAQRGNRSLRAVDLYVSGTSGRSGNAFINMRPESSLIVRSAALSSVLIACVLTLLWALGHGVARGGGKHVDAVAAALVVIPGLLTVVSVRDAEHPLATSMVFGLRLLAIVPGLLAFVGAGEVLFGSARSTFGIVLFGIAWLTATVLMAAWRLAVRGRPDPSALS